MSRPSHSHEPAVRADDDHDAPPRETLVFDRAAARAVDRAAIDEFGIPGMVLMENAARGLAEYALRMLAEANALRNVLIVCGSGNNGGDGYAAARHLHNRGVEVTIAALGRPLADSVAGVNRGIGERMRLAMTDAAELNDARTFTLIIDAIFGTGLDREVAGDAERVIRCINESERPILSADVPSGMDCDSGRPLGECVRAAATVTFVGLKPGYLELDAQKLLGEVVITDIGVPREVLERFGQRVSWPHWPEAPERSVGASSQRRPGWD